MTTFRVELTKAIVFELDADTLPQAMVALDLAERGGELTESWGKAEATIDWFDPEES